MGPHRDLDLAVYLTGKPTFEIHQSILDVCAAVVGPVRCDLGFLNGADPVYRFEALKGRLLFSRDEELRARFFSLTCREYETQMIHYERQLAYRRGART